MFDWYLAPTSTSTTDCVSRRIRLKEFAWIESFTNLNKAWPPLCEFCFIMVESSCIPYFANTSNASLSTYPYRLAVNLQYDIENLGRTSSFFCWIGFILGSIKLIILDGPNDVSAAYETNCRSSLPDRDASMKMGSWNFLGWVEISVR